MLKKKEMVTFKIYLNFDMKIDISHQKDLILCIVHIRFILLFLLQLGRKTVCARLPESAVGRRSAGETVCSISSTHTHTQTRKCTFYMTWFKLYV